MIPETVEKAIREFDWDDFGQHLTDAGPSQEWPAALASVITVAIMKDIAAALNAAWGVQ